MHYQPLETCNMDVHPVLYSIRSVIYILKKEYNNDVTIAQCQFC